MPDYDPFCPRCGQSGRIRPDGADLRCHACGHGWASEAEVARLRAEVDRLTAEIERLHWGISPSRNLATS